MYELEELARAEAGEHLREARHQQLVAVAHGRDQGLFKKVTAAWRELTRFHTGGGPRVRPGHGS